MKSSFAVLSLSMLIALLSGAQAQLLRSCETALADLSQKSNRIFENAEGTANIDAEICVDFNAFVLRRYYYCRQGFFAFLPKIDTPEKMATVNFKEIIDLNALAEKLNTTDTLLICLFVPAPPPPPPTTRPPPPSVGQCPRGPTRINQYIRQDRDGLCVQSCSFGTSVFGISTGSRSRTIYRCCKGDAILVSRASRLYRCP